MMTKIVSAAAVLAIAGTAFAQGNPWLMRANINFGNSELITNSEGIVPTTSFYTNSFGSINGAPNPLLFAVDEDLEWDSYWAIGSGPVLPGGDPVTNFSEAYAGSGLPFVLDAQKAENNAGFATPGVGAEATLKEVNGLLGWALFVGRLTTVGEGSEIVTKDGGTVFGSMNVFAGGGQGLIIPLTLNTGVGFAGPSGIEGELGEQLYYLVSEVTEGTLADGTVVRAHDLYFTTTIPTPGAVALFGLAGLAAARRRRA